MTTVLRRAALGLLLLSGIGSAHAQSCISLAPTDVAVTESFDTLVSSGTSATPAADWALRKTGTSGEGLYAASTAARTAASAIASARPSAGDQPPHRRRLSWRPPTTRRPTATASSACLDRHALARRCAAGKCRKRGSGRAFCLRGRTAHCRSAQRRMTVRWLSSCG